MTPAARWFVIGCVLSVWIGRTCKCRMYIVQRMYVCMYVCMFACVQVVMTAAGRI